MHGYLGMSRLGGAGLKHAASSVGIVTLGGPVICFRSVGYNREAGDGPPMTIRTRLSELASGYTLLPDARLEVMVVTHRMGKLRLEVLQLLLTVAV